MKTTSNAKVTSEKSESLLKAGLLLIVPIYKQSRLS